MFNTKKRTKSNYMWLCKTIKAYLLWLEVFGKADVGFTEVTVKA